MSFHVYIFRSSKIAKVHIRMLHLLEIERKILKRIVRLVHDKKETEREMAETQSISELSRSLICSNDIRFEFRSSKIAKIYIYVHFFYSKLNEKF